MLEQFCEVNIKGHGLKGHGIKWVNAASWEQMACAVSTGFDGS